MKKSICFLLIFFYVLQSCVSETCDKSCVTPPQSFFFELVDNISKENLFTKDIYESGEIEITNTLNDNASVDLIFITENDVNLIQINTIGWETETVNLRFKISELHIFDFYVDAVRNAEDCCSYTSYNEISVRDSEFELDSESGIYKILVEQN